MLRRIVSVVVLALLLMSMLTLTFDIQQVKADGIIYIRADGSVDPPTAKISTFDNITYNFTGNIYFYSIVVERSNIIIDGKIIYSLRGSDIGCGFNLTSISNVTIKNTNIEHFFYGIYLNHSSDNGISGNIITSNSGNGIYFLSSHNNSISGNNISTNDGDGIYILSSNNNTISGNDIIGNNNGIGLSDSSISSINANTIMANGGAGIFLTHSSNNNMSGNELEDNDYGIYLYSSSNNNSISEETITSNDYYGITLDSSSNSSISENDIIANNVGIKFIDSSNNTLRNNSMAYNEYNFDVRGDSLSDFLHDVNASNTVDGKPIYYWINKTDNTVPPDAGYVALINSTHIIVQNLSLTNNGQGILLAYTTNSTITQNNVTNNYFGMRVWASSNNSIYHNKFVDNIQQVAIQSGSVNFWDDGYPSGGNYWSDYTGVDWCSGPYQNETGSDGIGDTPYYIDSNNSDHYPLMKPYAGPHDIGIINITISKTVVGQGDYVDVDVKIVNYGINAETFNVTAYANITLIAAPANITLVSRNSTTITFAWNTTGFAKGNYTINAIADTVPGETDPSDNLFIDGWVFVLSSGHDVAILNISSRPIVGAGYTSPIQVVPMNVGNYTETFNVTLYINTLYIASQNVTLESGASTILTFTWNTSGFAQGNYTIGAVADQVLGETDILDNNFTGQWILVAKVGDFGSGVPPRFFDCDGKVDGKDFSLFLLCFKGTAPQEAMYLGDLGGSVPPQFFKCDGKVDAKDFSLFLQCFKGLGP